MKEMKKTAILFVTVMAAFFFASCNKEVALETEVVPEDVQPVKPTVLFNITVGDFNPETRAAKANWVNGDKVNIWFDGNCQPEPDVVLTYDGSWVAGNLRTGCELTKAQGKLLAVYENGNDLSGLDPKKDPTYNNSARFSFERESFNNGSDVNYAYYSRIVAYAKQQEYTLVDGILTASIEAWVVPIGIQITVTGLVPGKKYCLKANDSQFKVHDSFRVDDGTVILGLHEQTAAATSSPDGEAVFYFCNYTTVDHNNYPLPLILIPLAENGSHQMFYDATLPTLKGRERYQAFKVNVSKFEKRTINGHEYVDLGLPSGIKWATCNVGADRKTDTGDYYAWGETELYYVYGFDRWRFTRNGGYTQGNYTVKDFKDAASTVFGSSWRMPTILDWQELKDYCRWEWQTIQDYFNGYEVTSKVNGRSIFLRAAGDLNGEEFESLGTAGYYWTSEGVPSTSNANVFYFSASQITPAITSRWLGLPIRPVSD